MSTKKYTDAILNQYHYWKGHGESADDFCRMKGLNRQNLSLAYIEWKKRKGIK